MRALRSAMTRLRAGAGSGPDGKDVGMREARVSTRRRRARRASVLAAAVLLAFVVCSGLVVPSSAASDVGSDEATTASDDDETTSERRHGTISITCDAADDDDVIELEVGETADIIIAPYTHLQWLGCTKLGCPDQCEDIDHAGEGLTCFYQGFGCVCDGTKVARSVDLTVTTGNDWTVSVADVVVDSSWINGDNTNFSDKTRPVTKNGTVTVTATEVGTTTVTVDAQTCEDASAVYYDHDTTLIVLWHPMTVTYTVVVTDSDCTDINDADVTLPQTGYDYTGSAIEPVPSVTYGGETLVAGEDYTVSYTDNVDAGTAYVTVRGMGDYAGRASVAFEIRALELSEVATLGDIASCVYTGCAAEPDVTVTGTTALSADMTLDEDYTLSYADNVNAGTASVTVTGMGNFTGSLAGTFTIEPAAIADQTIAAIETQLYTGEALEPGIEATNATSGEALVEGEDYTLAYADNVDVGTASVTVTGIGNYTGTTTVTFDIGGVTIASQTMELATTSYTYTGLACEPAVTIVDSSSGETLVEGTDYTVSYADNVDAGTAYAIISGLGNYAGTAQLAFEITQAVLSSQTFEAISSQTYAAAEIEPSVTVCNATTGAALVEGDDYTLSYADNVDVGTAYVTVTGMGNYVGSKTLGFRILAASIADASVSDMGSYTYTGDEIEPDPLLMYNAVMLELGEDYTVSYADNVDAGTGYATFAGMGNFTDSLTVAFEIGKAAQSLAFASDTFELHAGTTGENALSGAVGDVTWESSDEYVATVADDGTLTAGYAGTATITATAAGDDNYEEATASFELTVTDHSYVGVVTEPTCETSGYTTWTCSVCGDTFVSAVTAATGHSYELVVAVEATCTQAGSQTYVCSTCGASYTETLEATGHDYDYGGGTWEWADDCSAATYTVTCANDESHTCAYEASVTSATSGRTTTYAASVDVEGETYTSEQVVALFEFSDVVEGSWYEESVYALFDAGYVNGYTDTQTGELTGIFGVGDSMTRAQFATILWRIACPDDYAAYEAAYAAAGNAYDCANTSGLADVSDDRYYTAAVNWAVSEGVITGFTSGTYAGMFRPNASITFEQLCLVVARYCYGATDVVAENAETMLASFKDGSSVSSWAAEGVAWCVEEGLVSGYASTNTLAPAEQVARERVATVIYRGLELLLAVG